MGGLIGTCYQVARFTITDDSLQVAPGCCPFGLTIYWHLYYAISCCCCCFRNIQVPILHKQLPGNAYPDIIPVIIKWILHMHTQQITLTSRMYHLAKRVNHVLDVHPYAINTLFMKHKKNQRGVAVGNVELLSKLSHIIECNNLCTNGFKNSLHRN